jgi:hypothetical protein
LILVPVSIGDKGPYLFMVDPDSPESSVDNLISQENNLFSSGRSRRYTEADFVLNVPIVEVPEVHVGDLTVRQQRFRVHDAGTYWSKGRRIRGVLGRDIIADSLIYTIDRDAGMLYIGTQGHLDPPKDAIKLEFSQGFNALLRHYMYKVKLNRQKTVTMHLDLGGRTSQLLPEVTSALKVPPVNVEATVIDEYGTRRKVDQGAVIGIVEAGKAEVNGLLVLPFADKRVDEQEFQGKLGQNFFSKFLVTVDWHHKTFYLKRRSGDLFGTAQARLERWGNALAGCTNPGCIQANIIKPQSEAPPAEAPPAEAPPAEAPPAEAPPAKAPGTGGPETPAGQPANVPQGGPAPGAQPEYILQLDRDPAGQKFAYDVLLDAVDAEGRSLGLPKITATFDAGVPGMSQRLPQEYGKAEAFVLLDLNVIGIRSCGQNKTSCVQQLR